MTPHAGWPRLEALAHLEEVQLIIQREIARGTIRVVPTRGDRIRIIPLQGHTAPPLPGDAAACHPARGTSASG